MHMWSFLLVVFIIHNVIEPLPSLKLKDDDNFLKEQLLKLLGRDERPAKSMPRLRVPHYLLELYREQAQSDGMAREVKKFHSTVIRTLFDEENLQSMDKVLFNISSIPSEETVTSAQLRVFLHSRHNHGNQLHNVSVYRLESGNSSLEDKTSMSEYFVASQLVWNEKSLWVEFDISNAVNFWRRFPHLNFGLRLIARPFSMNKSTGILTLRKSHNKRTMLITFNKDKPLPISSTYSTSSRTRIDYNKPTAKKRKKSMKRIRREVENTERYCKRKSLTVKFQDLEWNDWVIAPASFTAYYCHGDCPEVIDDHFNPTNHAIVQNLLHFRHNKDIPRACCVPTELLGLSMLYVEDSGNIVLKEYPEMVATQCGCR